MYMMGSIRRHIIHTLIISKNMVQRAVNIQWLRDTATDIKNGTITMKKAADEVLFDTVDGFKEKHKISTKQLQRYFNEYNIKIFEVGRRGFKKKIPDSLIDEVSKTIEKDQVGITKTWMILNKKNIQCSRNEVNQAVEILDKKDEKPKKEPKVRCRYLVEKVNGVWHGDIHYIVRPFNTMYIFALIDDMSRYIVGYNIFKSKTAANVKKVFSDTINTNGVKPLAFWSDNGLENVAAEMKAFLSDNNIYQILTVPGNPQSNGKIERFWPELEKRINGITSWTKIHQAIDSFIEEYNYVIPHMALDKDEDGFNKRPADVYLDESLQATDIYNTRIKIDNKPSISLAEFIKIRSSAANEEVDPSNIFTLLN